MKQQASRQPDTPRVGTPHTDDRARLHQTLQGSRVGDGAALALNEIRFANVNCFWTHAYALQHDRS